MIRMSAHPADVQAVIVSSGTEAEPLYFSGDAGQLFGWLHRAGSGQRTDLGLVICKPFGYEALCAHRSLRAFAQMAAASGVATLNFDYAGTGDSAEIDGNAEQIEAWCRAVVNAVIDLRR